VLAAGLVAARLWLPLSTVLEVVAVASVGLVAYFALYYTAWLRPSERVLLGDLARLLVQR
jgi:hypothetical protein